MLSASDNLQEQTEGTESAAVLNLSVLRFLLLDLLWDGEHRFPNNVGPERITPDQSLGDSPDQAARGAAVYQPRVQTLLVKPYIFATVSRNANIRHSRKTRPPYPDIPQESL
jgi:hypothetical protein